jgi:hypothetical protein
VQEKPSNDQTTATAALEPAPMVSPSPTFYSELAQSLITAIDQFTAAIPEFDNPIVSDEFVVRKRGIREAFVTEAVSALLVHTELQNMKQLNAVEALDDKQYIDAFVPLVRHLQSALRGLRSTIKARKARLAGNAQLIYTVAKAFTRDRKASSLVEHVGNMKRSLATTPRRKRVAAPAGGGTAQPGGKEETTTSKPQQQQ